MKTVALYTVKPDGAGAKQYLAAVVADENDNLYTYSNKDGAWEKDTMHHSDLAFPQYDYNEWDIYPVDLDEPKAKEEQTNLQKAFREQETKKQDDDSADDDDDDDDDEVESVKQLLAAIEKGDKPGHPFRGNQYTGGMGGAPVVAGDPAAGGLTQYLDMVSQHFEKGSGFTTFIRKHGKSYAFDDSSFVGGGKPQQCFKNATLASMANPDLTYVEGYVSVHGVPIHHAWNVNKAGKVIDTTITDPVGKLGYYGVPFTQRYLHETMRETEHYGVMTDLSATKTVLGDPAKMVKK